MSFIKKNRSRITVGAVIAIILIAAFWWGGDSPDSHGFNVEESTKESSHAESYNVKSSAEDVTEIPDSASQDLQGREVLPENEQMPQPQAQDVQPDRSQAEDMQTAQSQTEDMQTEQPALKDTEFTEPVPRCTLSVSCHTILDNISRLDSEKTDIVPADGIILPETEVTFSDGESVFDVLTRVMKNNKIHMEFVTVPLYGSAYIEGIANLYEFDCGELSGWMYKVNGMFPQYGCSQYSLTDGDKIEFIYTCNLGRDVGGSNGINLN